MPNSRESLCVLTELNSLSVEADHLADSLPKVSDLEPFFNAIKDTVLKIKECTSAKQLKEIALPPDIHYYLNKKETEEKIRVIQTPKSQKEHVHAEKVASSVYKTAEKDIERGKREKTVTTIRKSSEDKVLDTCHPTPVEKSNSILSISKLNKQTPKFPKISYDEENSELFKTPFATPKTVEIPPPVLNRTITKESSQALVNKNLLPAAEESMRMTRSGSRNKAQGSNPDASLSQISSGVKKRLQDENMNSSSQVRSGSKRKSASSSKEKIKKPKMEVKNKSQISQSKQALKNNILKPANGPILNSKQPAVIVPTLKHSITLDVNLKEKKLEEIQKKEEKANENRKKVLAIRQLKAEEQKKKREEKMEKALQKRLLLDKEKDHDRSIDTKMSQVKVEVENVKKLVLKPKSKELEEQQVPKAPSVPVHPSASHKEMNVQTANKTPAKKSPPLASETYDLTPAPDSSTYDFSDEEENQTQGKPIPSWAQGINLKSALMHQFYNPPDTYAIFGSFIAPPDLAVLFGVNKNYYSKRTSSAIWHTTPY